MRFLPKGVIEEIELLAVVVLEDIKREGPAQSRSLGGRRDFPDATS
jgi:hypothetical protein